MWSQLLTTNCSLAGLTPSGLSHVSLHCSSFLDHSFSETNSVDLGYHPSPSTGTTFHCLHSAVFVDLSRICVGSITKQKKKQHKVSCVRGANFKGCVTDDF